MQSRTSSGGGGTKAAVPRPPDPILALPELAWLLVAAPTLRQKDFMNLPDEPQGKRKAPAKPAETMVQRRDVVRDFLDVVQRHARHLVILK
jgi:hypothetical protein